jgi:hypothetical protein
MSIEVSSKLKGLASAGGILSVAVVIGILLFGTQGQAGVTTLTVNVITGEYRQGDTINVSIVCVPDSYVKAWECKLNFNDNVLNAIQVEEGNFFSGYDTFFNAGIIDNNNGTIINMYNLIMGQGNVTGVGTLVDITFHAVGCGLSNISLYDVGVTNETMYVLSEFINTSVFIYSQYDMNCDQVVNLQDIILVACHYGETGEPGWIPEDVDEDGEIRIIDLVLVLLHWGEY